MSLLQKINMKVLNKNLEFFIIKGVGKFIIRRSLEPLCAKDTAMQVRKLP